MKKAFIIIFLLAIVIAFSGCMQEKSKDAGTPETNLEKSQTINAQNGANITGSETAKEQDAETAKTYCEEFEAMVEETDFALSYFEGKKTQYKFVKGNETNATIQLFNESNEALTEQKELKENECISFDNKQYLILESLNPEVSAGGDEYLFAKLKFTCNCSTETKQKTLTAEELAVKECENLCKDALKLDWDLSNGPCLSSATLSWEINDWVCDIAHNPRTDVDDNPANQCPEFGVSANHFVEFSPECEFIKKY